MEFIFVGFLTTELKEFHTAFHGVFWFLDYVKQLLFNLWFGA